MMKHKLLTLFSIAFTAVALSAATAQAGCGGAAADADKACGSEKVAAAACSTELAANSCDTKKDCGTEAKNARKQGGCDMADAAACSIQTACAGEKGETRSARLVRHRGSPARS
jgi:hypothetical protein